MKCDPCLSIKIEQPPFVAIAVWHLPQRTKSNAWTDVGVIRLEEIAGVFNNTLVLIGTFSAVLECFTSSFILPENFYVVPTDYQGTTIANAIMALYQSIQPPFIVRC